MMKRQGLEGRAQSREAGGGGCERCARMERSGCGSHAEEEDCLGSRIMAWLRGEWEDGINCRGSSGLV